MCIVVMPCNILLCVPCKKNYNIACDRGACIRIVGYICFINRHLSFRIMLFMLEDAHRVNTKHDSYERENLNMRQ